MSHQEEDNRIRIANEQETADFAPPEGRTESAVGVAAPPDEASELRGQVADLRDKYLRARAEVDNIARRARQEQSEAVRYGNAELLKSVLGVVDDVERTLAAATSGSESGPIVEAVKLIHEKLGKLLRENAVEPVEAVGKVFSPTDHSALLQQPSKQHSPGTVIQEVQKGYRYRDRVLRPAQVIVAAPPADLMEEKLGRNSSSKD